LFSEQASKRVSLGLILSKVVEDNQLKADEDAVREQVEEIASQYETKDEVVDYYYNNPQQLQQVEALVLENQVVDFLLAQADVSDEKLSYEELIQLSANQQI
jgi:trigger factor